MPSNHLILCRPLLLPPSIFPSIRVFSNESALCIRWPKYWSFNFNISSSNEHPGLISFRMDWLDLFAVKGTLKSLLQHHSLKASILWCSAFLIVQLSHPYMTTGKTIALTRRTLVNGNFRLSIVQTKNFGVYLSIPDPNLTPTPWPLPLTPHIPSSCQSCPAHIFSLMASHFSSAAHWTGSHSFLLGLDRKSVV